MSPSTPKGEVDGLYDDLGDENSVDESEKGKESNVAAMRTSKRVGIRRMASLPRTKESKRLLADASHEELLQRVYDLESENATLKRNISTLYRSSREEIKRKDAIIESLQENSLKFGE